MGAFKPLMLFDGRPLLHHAIAALARHCDEVLVMAGPRAADVFRVAQGARVLADPGEGPVVALRLAAHVAHADVLLTAPADAPFLRPETYGPLLDAGPNATFAIQGMPEPLVACYARAAILAFEGRSLLSLDARRLDVPPGLAAQLRDVDTPQDVSAAEDSERP